MRRNLIPNVDKFDWSDRNRQSEYVNSVVSALNALGENLTYDYVCAVSGSAFRTSFSMKTYCEFNHGNYHVINTPDIIEHTFRVLGYEISHYVRGDFNRDCKIIMDSIDKGFPVITLEGVIDCSDACIITGYDNDGQVLLGYNPFMDVEDDHKEMHDSTGYFRKSGWHEGFFEKENGHIIVIHGKCEKPDEERIFEETLELVAKLIRKENMAVGQYNGLLAHRQFAEALMTYEWEDNFEPYLNVMCNYKQYLDRQYAVEFLKANHREDLAAIYSEITELVRQMGKIIPQDFSAADMFSSKDNLRTYCDILMQIHDLEEKRHCLYETNY